MSSAYGDTRSSRSSRLDRILAELVGQVPEVEAASVVSFDGLAMASALPHGMDEDRVAAMSAALLSLGERAAGLMLFEVRRAAAAVADVLRVELAYDAPPVEVAPPASPQPLQVVSPSRHGDGGTNSPAWS